MAANGKFTLIQQNDTHAQMELHWEGFWRNGELEYRKAGGYGRAAAIVRQIRQEAPAALFVDCGDSIHGTGPAQWTQGACIVPALNAEGIELLVPGNWEYGFGPAVLRDRIREMHFPVIACNVEEATTSEKAFAPCEVRELGGIPVGLMGVTSPIVTQTMPDSFGAGLRFLDPVDVLPNAIAKVRRGSGAELVVVVSHWGFAQDVQLAQEVQGIDIILSSHTHNRLARPVIVGKTIIIQSGFSGSFLGRLDIEVRHGHIEDYQHQLIRLDESIEPDAGVQRVIDQQLQPYRDQLNEVVGQTATPLHRMTVLESTMDNLITDAYLDTTGADVAFSHGWRYGPPVPAGDVTVGNLWEIIPTNPEIMTVELTGEQILQRLEANLESVFAGDTFKQKGGYVMRTSGLSAIVRLNNPKGTRVEHLDIAGAEMEPDRLYTLAVGGEQALQGAEGKATGVKAIDALRDYLGKHSPVDASLTGRKFVAV
jgi:S-sulfosulfanyl-L-cysteine sulfohydrolase